MSVPITRDQPTTADDQPIVSDLKRRMAEPKHAEWEKLLLDSITEAKKVALDDGMAAAEDWPDGLEGDTGYYAYLNRAVRWIPRQDYTREMFVALCTFYWLIDQPAGRELQKDDDFQQWASDFARAWGSFLDTPESAAGISTFEADPSYNVWQYQKPANGWKTFNQFFSRQVKPGLRPVAGIHLTASS